MPKIHISVTEAFADSVRVVELQLEAGAIVADAINAPQVLNTFPDAPQRAFGIYSTRVEASTVLHEGDRIELYRPLIADAKQNRMERVRAGREANRRR